jgi:parallel beta helix pectate lyase-like protein
MTPIARGCGIPLLLLLVGLAAAAEAAPTLAVATNGVDTASCGTAGHPCRSISRAIANAPTGSRIEVGPGVYGDLDNDGSFTSVGEEAAQPGRGCDCMIRVGKTLTIVSRDGADATVLDAGAASLNVVVIDAAGVVFGQPQHGFTVYRGGKAGVVVAADRAHVDGNVVSLNGLDFVPGGTPWPGFDVGGRGSRLEGNLATQNTGNGYLVAGAGHRLEGNMATGNDGAGFFVTGNGHLARRNIANTTGGAGFYFEGNDLGIVGNAAGGNGDGFQIAGAGVVVDGNVASGNMASGFLVFGVATSVTFTGNAARGNGAAGVELVAPATLAGNDFYGNGRDPAADAANCGVRNSSGATIVATRNFWGAATGPGADPADEACDVSGATLVSPFATRPFNVRTFPRF